MRINDFVRKWGNVPLVRAWDGSLSIYGSEGTIGDLVLADLAEVDPKDPHVARVRHNPYTSNLRITNPKNWNIPDDPLRAKTIGGQALSKLSWNPLSGIAILSWPGSQHADAIRGHGNFDDFVRVIILPSLNKVAFRPFLPSWAPKDMDEADAFDISYGAQEACEKALRAAGAKGWDFQYNIDNPMLTKMTGFGWW